MTGQASRPETADPSPPTEGDRIGMSFFTRPVWAVAAGLIGSRLLVDGVGGVIVETEAYGPADPASHSFKGPTPRNAAMFGAVGHAYVYRSYGLHWCFNIVCGEAGSAVLVRALAPMDGVSVMQARRGREAIRDLCRGPGRVCAALAIDARHDGAPVAEAPFCLVPAAAPPEIVTGPRIGITKGIETQWRFGMRGSTFLSRSFGSERLGASSANTHVPLLPRGI